MPDSRVGPQARFLLRGSALVLVMLGLWWFVLLNPLVDVLRGAVQICGSVIWGTPASQLLTETAVGDWSFEFPIEFREPLAPPRAGFQQIHSLGFDIPRPSVLAFTFSLPVFWALMLAAPGLRRNGRALLLGTVAMVTVETALVLAMVEISAHQVAGQLARTETGSSQWALHFGQYLSVDVIPFVAPFLMALWLHDELRSAIFGGGAESLPKTARADHKKPRRRQAAVAR